jgi:hypothetical protein
MPDHSLLWPLVMWRCRSLGLANNRLNGIIPTTIGRLTALT